MACSIDLDSHDLSSLDKVYRAPAGRMGRSRAAVPGTYRSRMRWIAGLAITVVLAGCLTAGPGACSAEEAAAFNEIDHFGEEPLVPEDHPYGICAATFTTDVEPNVIIGHYRTVLRQAGWTVQEAESSPITDEGGAQVGTSIGLAAAKGTKTFSLGAELLVDGAEPPTFNVLVGEGSS